MKEYRVAKKTVALVEIHENLSIKAENAEEAELKAEEKSVNLKKAKISIGSIEDSDIIVY